MRFVRMWVGERTASDYQRDVMLILGPKLTIAAAPSAPIPNADPKPLFWVTGIVLGLLAMWVAYVFFAGETRKPIARSVEPKASGDGAE